jgi:hypothetical protein
LYANFRNVAPDNLQRSAGRLAEAPAASASDAS